MNYYHINDAPFIKEMKEMTHNLWINGWAENHAGNISYLLQEDEVKLYLNISQYRYEKDIGFSVPDLKGKYFLVTGAGKSFRNVVKDPSDSLAIIKINDEGTKYQLLWGLSSGGEPTSEFASHLMCHSTRLKVDNQHRVILHTHAMAITAMTFIHTLDEDRFTKTLWKMITECIMTFPDGIAVLPWMVAGTSDLGKASAKKMEISRIVIWPQHGIMSAGRNMDDAYGLIETAEKAANIYLLAKQGQSEDWQDITDQQLWSLIDRFDLIPKQGILEPR
ncbi:rhamnulose-1-phosphate aldolase [Enterococcus casseliflavus]|uniref:rhamnulose-1-phosphate aldolase n=1 Tax=Enterococcus casseliflavus TaxID=37734 RepID=UPI0022E6A24D|nr:rhamnulose-1-phosphate aldolase [Enterococcus casseliflavus]